MVQEKDFLMAHCAEDAKTIISLKDALKKNKELLHKLAMSMVTTFEEACAIHGIPVIQNA